MVSFFFWKPTENMEKSRPIWRDNLFFFGDQQKTRKKLDQFGAMTFFLTENPAESRPAQKFWPPYKEILLPLEQRSSCGTGQMTKQNRKNPLYTAKLT